MRNTTPACSLSTKTIPNASPTAAADSSIRRLAILPGSIANGSAPTTPLSMKRPSFLVRRRCCRPCRRSQRPRTAMLTRRLVVAVGPTVKLSPSQHRHLLLLLLLRPSVSGEVCRRFRQPTFNRIMLVRFPSESHDLDSVRSRSIQRHNR